MKYSFKALPYVREDNEALEDTYDNAVDNKKEGHNYEKVDACDKFIFYFVKPWLLWVSDGICLRLYKHVNCVYNCEDLDEVYRSLLASNRC